jgi:hypothetical protein
MSLLSLAHVFLRFFGSCNGRFIILSVIKNIYNKKTKGPTLMEWFKSTGKLKKCFLTTKDVRCVQHGWHDTHRYDIQVLATHASTCCNDPCLKAKIIAAVNNIDAATLTRVCSKDLNIVSMCAVSPVAYTSNISSCQKNFSSFSVAVNNSIKVGPLVYLL